MDVLGRHGPGPTSLLEELADRARLCALEAGRPPTRAMRTWRIRLSAAAARLVGRGTALAILLGPELPRSALRRHLIQSDLFASRRKPLQTSSISKCYTD